MTRPPFHSLAWSFLKIGAGAFGGGMAALPVFEAELVRRRHWLVPTEVAETYAISQSVPGVIMINFAVLTGLRLAGKRGAVLAAFTMVLPAFFIILALAAFFTGRWENRWVAAALSGLRPTVVAIVAGAAIRLARGHFRSPLFLLATAAGAALMVAKFIAPVPLILIGVAAGLAWHALRRGKETAP
jgi:chromate transporter